MRFVETRLHNEIITGIRAACDSLGLVALRADDRTYSDDLLLNIRTYMHGCDLGIAIFERLTQDEFNPNISLELGYMLALGKPVCLLKDTTLGALHTDVVGRLYESFDAQNPSQSIQNALERWLRSKSLG